MPFTAFAAICCMGKCEWMSAVARATTRRIQAGRRSEEEPKGHRTSMSRFYRVSRFAVSTEKNNTARSSAGVRALPNERNSTSDSWRCFRYRPSWLRRSTAMCYVSRPIPSLFHCSFLRILTPSFDQTRSPTGRIKSFNALIWEKKNNHHMDVTTTIIEVDMWNDTISPGQIGRIMKIK